MKTAAATLTLSCPRSPCQVRLPRVKGVSRAAGHSLAVSSPRLLSTVASVKGHENYSSEQDGRRGTQCHFPTQSQESIKLKKYHHFDYIFMK